jgi:hypothetical protein
LWTGLSFESFLTVLPVVGSRQVKEPPLQYLQTRGTGTAYSGSHGEACNEGCSLASRIGHRGKVKYFSWNMAYLASRVGVIVGVAIVVVLPDSIYRGVDSIHQLCKTLASSPTDFFPPSSHSSYEFRKRYAILAEYGDMG